MMPTNFEIIGLAQVQVTLEGEPPRIVNLTPMPRAANPLLSLLSQPLASDSDNEETSGYMHTHIYICICYYIVVCCFP